MANHKSAKKADRQSKVRRERNQDYLSRAKTSIRKLRSALAAKAKPSQEELRSMLKETQSTLMRVAQKGALKSKTASRYFSRLSTAVEQRLK